MALNLAQHVDQFNRGAAAPMKATFPDPLGG